MISDLSESHQPLTDLFAPSADISEFRLQKEQIDQFNEQGFLAGVPMLTANQVDALRKELTEFQNASHAGQEYWYEYNADESTDPNTVLFHALGAWRLGTGFHDMLWNPAFTVPASQLLQGPVRFWHDQLFHKPAHHGGVVAWHQDYSYWTRTQPVAHLTCWIALDDASVENGCVHYIPGSHRWELLPITGLAGDMTAISNVLSTDQLRSFENPVAAEMKAGECVFHHSLMVHGSHENRTARPRRATVINAVRDGVCSSSNEPLLEGVPAIPAGSPLSGQFFPLLYAPRS
ncbi:MAG: phytanoyl-CoA dioxygenase family protein [Planctomycetaceae bacterium]|nr:phytanoyl-CoA dioxygenase family protein [Planctomycetaceae bacterium]